jgi:hypothetical protein
MEELRSTDSLDKEILEDAAKKSAKVLKTAGEQIAAAAAEWERKLAGLVEIEKNRYAEKLKIEKAEIASALVLDKRRAKLQRCATLLAEAAAAFFAALPRPLILITLEKELRIRLDAVFAETAQKNSEKYTKNIVYHLNYRGLSPDELSKLLASLKADYAAWETAGFDTREAGGAVLPEIIVETADWRLTASLEAAADELLLEKRAELAAALLGTEAVDG